MTPADLSIRDLEAVLAVATHEHFGRAAAALRIAQPTLSSRVQPVELALQVTLFERTSRRFLVTVEGRQVIPIVRETLESARRLAGTGGAPGARAVPTPIRLGIIPTLAPYLMPHPRRISPPTGDDESRDAQVPGRGGGGLFAASGAGLRSARRTARTGSHSRLRRSLPGAADRPLLPPLARGARGAGGAGDIYPRERSAGGRPGRGGELFRNRCALSAVLSAARAAAATSGRSPRELHPTLDRKSRFRTCEIPRICPRPFPCPCPALSLQGWNRARRAAAESGSRPCPLRQRAR